MVHDKDLERLLTQWQTVRRKMYEAHTCFADMLKLYQETALPRLKELAGMDSILTLPDRVLELEPLPVLPPESEKEADAVLSPQGIFAGPLEHLKNVLSLTPGKQKNEGGER